MTIKKAPVQVKKRLKLIFERAAIDQIAQCDRDEQAERGAQQWPRRRTTALSRRLGGGPEEQCGFEALATDS